MEPLLEIRGLNVDYGATRALHDINLTLVQGGTLAMVGTNGAGKTTLLRTLSGLVKATSGKIILESAPIDGLPPHQIVRRGVAHVPEGRCMFPYLTTEMNIRLGGFTRKDRAAVEREVHQALERWEIVGRRRNAAAGTMSGGEQQLVAILRGVLAAPKLLLLDEPSLGLAPTLVKEIYRVISTLASERKIAVLLVEQNAARALEFAQSVCVLVAGRIVYSSSSASISSAKIADMYFGRTETVKDFSE